MSERDQSDRQEGEWSIPASVAGKNGSLVEQESPHRTPLAPSPSEDRFTNWSSLGSLCLRAPPQSVLMGETGQDINQPVNQTTQPGSEPTQIGATGNALQNDIIASCACQQLDELGVRMIDMGTNTSDLEVRPHRDGARAVTSDTNIQAPLPLMNVMIPSGGGDLVAIPQINLSISGYGPDSHVGTPAMRTQEIPILPQLDGPVSIPVRGLTGGRVSDDTRFAE